MQGHSAQRSGHGDLREPTAQAAPGLIAGRLTGAFVDTGGNGGNIPSDIVNGYQPGQYLPAGTQIQVDIPNGQGGAEELYSETVGANSMQVTVSQTAPPPDGPGAFNTGNYVFKQMPIYFSYSPAGGTIEFDPAI